MKKQLYKYIEELHNKKTELADTAEKIKYDHSKQDELQDVLNNYKKIEESLSLVEKSINISPLGVAEILSYLSMQHYVLKTFKEMKTENGEKVYTGNFVSCYVCPKSMFYYYDINPELNSHFNGLDTDCFAEFSINETEYQELLLSLEETKSLVLLKNEDLGFSTSVAPTEFIKKINFISAFTNGKIDGVINPDFYGKLIPVIKNKIESVYVDENLNVVDFESEKE